MVDLVTATGVRMRASEERAKVLVERGFATYATKKATTPDETYTVAQIKAYAADNNINLDGITKKGDMLKAIREAK